MKGGDDIIMESQSPTQVRIRKRKLLIENMESELEKVGYGIPKTLLGMIQLLWEQQNLGNISPRRIDERNEDESFSPRLRVDEDRIVILPNGKELKGEFKATWGQVYDALSKLEQVLKIMIPPKTLKGSWKLRIPVFEQSKLQQQQQKQLMGDEDDMEEKIPKFSFSGKGVKKLPSKDSIDFPKTYQIISQRLKETKATRCMIELPKLLDQSSNMGNEEEAKTSPKSSSRFKNKNTKKGKSSSKRKPKTKEEVWQMQVDMCFGKQFHHTSYDEWKLVDHEKEAAALERSRAHRKRQLSTPTVTYKYPSLLDEDSSSIVLMDDSERKEEDIKMQQQGEGSMEDFLPPLKAEPIWDTNLAQQLIYKAEDLLLLRKTIAKRVNTVVPSVPTAAGDQPESSSSSAQNMTFTQIENIPGIRREELALDHGQCVMMVGQRYSYIEFAQNLGENPVVEILRAGNITNPISSQGGIEIHDVTNNGFVVFVSDIEKFQADDVFDVSKYQVQQPTDESEEQVVGSDLKIFWRAFHSDWVKHGAINLGSDGHIKTWNPKNLIRQGLIVDFPVHHSFIPPPLWTQEHSDMEIEHLVQIAKLQEIEEYVPPPYPQEKVTELHREKLQYMQYEKYHAVMVLDCSSQMLLHDMWQRAKFMLRSLLSPGTGQAEKVFANGGELRIIALGTDHAPFLLRETTSNALCEAQRWVASLETAKHEPGDFVEIIRKGLPYRCDAIHVITSRHDFLNAFMNNDGKHNLLSSLNGVPIHMVYLSMHEISAPQTLEYLDDHMNNVQSVQYLDFGGKYPCDLETSFLQLGEAKPLKGSADDSPPAKELNVVLEKYEKDVQQYDERYKGKAEQARESNRIALQGAKQEHQNRQILRQQALEAIRKVVEEERRRQVVWRWHNMALLAQKRSGLVGLNIFLAVASTKRVALYRRKMQQAQIDRRIAKGCAVDAIVSIIEQVMVETSRRRWLAHTENVRMIRHANEEAVSKARQLHQDQLQKMEDLKRRRTEAHSKRTNSQLQVLQLRKRHRIRELNEALLMESEERYQREVEKALKERANPYFETLHSTAKFKARLMDQLLSQYVAVRKKSKSLIVPNNPNTMIETFLPLRSHQERVYAWFHEVKDRIHIRNIEARGWRILKEEFLEKLRELDNLREKAMINNNINNEGDTLIANGPRKLEDVLNRTEKRMQDKFQAGIVEQKRKVEELVDLIEGEFPEIRVRGWHLLLQVAPFSKSVDSVRLDVSVSTQVLNILELLRRVEQEYEAGIEDETLATDLEIYGSTRFGSIDSLALDRIASSFEAGPNLELLRTFHARMGLGPLLLKKTTKGKRRRRSIVAKPWQDFSPKEVLHARNERNLIAIENWKITRMGHIEAELLGQQNHHDWAYDTMVQSLQKYNAELVEKEQTTWEQEIVQPILQRNKERQIHAINHQPKSSDEIKRQQTRLVKEAKERYEKTVLGPLQQFNATLEKLNMRTKAAKQELKLINTFRAYLTKRSKKLAVGGAESNNEDAIMSMPVLRNALHHAFSSQSQPVGSGCQLAKSRRNTANF